MLNAANEVAVEAFLDRRIPFSGIARVIRTTMSEFAPVPAGSLAEVLTAQGHRLTDRSRRQVPQKRAAEAAVLRPATVTLH